MRGAALPFAVALPLLASGPGWLREDWFFASRVADGGTGYFGLFRPVAELVHVAVFRLPPGVVLVAQTVLIALVGWLLFDVLQRFGVDRAMAERVAVVWLVLPIHAALSWWASGFYIVVALACGLQSLRSRTIGWLAAAAFCYEAVAVPLLVLDVWRRNWLRVAVSGSAVVLAVVANPMVDAVDRPLDPLDALRGTFGVGVAWWVGVVALIAALRDRLAMLGVGVAAVGLLPFALDGVNITFTATGDRATATAAIGVAITVAAVSGRWFPHVAAGLAALTLVNSVVWVRAHDAADAGLACASDGIVEPVRYGEVEAIPPYWVDEAIDVTTDGRIESAVIGECQAAS